MEERQPVCEAVESQHLEHLEDLMLKDPDNGIKTAITMLRDITRALASQTPTAQMHITTKWDGAPAIVAGKYPANKKFFVALKGATLSDNPKICHTPADITKHHGDKPELAEKLLACLRYLPAVLPSSGVYHGDLLFTNNKKKATIDGKQMVTFRPNTILYAVPVETPMGGLINTAKMGIVFHTQYSGSGKTLKDLSKSPLQSLQGFKKTTEVWFTGAKLPSPPSGSTFLTASNAEQIGQIVKQIIALAPQSKTFLKLVKKVHEKDIFNELMPFINSGIRAGISKYDSVKLGVFIEGKYNAAIGKLKTPAKIAQKKQDKAKALAFVKAYSEQFEQLFKVHSLLSEAKMIIVSKLSEVKTIGTYLPTTKGLKATNPEGFVAVCGKTCSTIKLIDRLEFANANMNIAKDWKI